jgi:catalase
MVAWDEAKNFRKEFDFHREDLWEAIETVIFRNGN